MGMYDQFRSDKTGETYQARIFDCTLRDYYVGDEVPELFLDNGDSIFKYVGHYSFDAYGDGGDVIFGDNEIEGLEDVTGFRNELAHVSSNGELLETTVDDLQPFVGTYLHPQEG